MRGNAGRNRGDPKAGELAEMLALMAAGEEAVRPEENAALREACGRFLAEGDRGPHAAFALPEVLEFIRDRPGLDRVSRAIESRWWGGDGPASAIFGDASFAADDGSARERSQDDPVVLNLRGIDDPRQLRAVAEVVREAAGEGDAVRIVLVGAEAMEPSMRTEFLAALSDEAFGSGSPGGAPEEGGRDEKSG